MRASASSAATRRSAARARDGEVSWRDALAWRVSRQHLERRLQAGQFIDIARRLCGLHAGLLTIRDAMEHMDEHIDALLLRRERDGGGLVLFEVFSGDMAWNPSGYSAFRIETRE